MFIPGINVCQISLHWVKWKKCFLHKAGSYFVYNVCQIYKKAQMIVNLSETAFYKVSKVSPDSTTHMLAC